MMEADLACDGGRMPYTFPGTNRVHMFQTCSRSHLIGMQGRRNMSCWQMAVKRCTELLWAQQTGYRCPAEQTRR